MLIIPRRKIPTRPALPGREFGEPWPRPVIPTRNMGRMFGASGMMLGSSGIRMASAANTCAACCTPPLPCPCHDGSGGNYLNTKLVTISGTSASIGTCIASGGTSYKFSALNINGTYCVPYIGKSGNFCDFFLTVETTGSLFDANVYSSSSVCTGSVTRLYGFFILVRLNTGVTPSIYNLSAGPNNGSTTPGVGSSEITTGGVALACGGSDTQTNGNVTTIFPTELGSASVTVTDVAC